MNWQGARAADKLIDVVGAIFLLLVWTVVKYGFGVSDRYLPSPFAVITAFRDIEPSILIHTLATLLRLATGGVAGVVLGIAMALAMFRWPALDRLLLPSVQALRSVPPVATVPFFLLWFGFEEKGKLILILLGIGLNVLVAAYQILEEAPDKYVTALASYNHSLRQFPISVGLPLILERILPTIRTSLSIAFGVVIVAELLGSQRGLGYLIQTSRTTYAIHVIFLATIILGVLNLAIDSATRYGWVFIVPWRKKSSERTTSPA